MSFEAKKQAAMAELENSKIWRSNYEPPFLLFMWWLGKETRPPHYNSFMCNALSLGSFFAVGWGLIMWLFVWSSTGLSALAAIGATLLAGLSVGLIVAYYYSFSAKRNKLSRWKELPETDESADQYS
ncbi:DUF6404 family protein [Idiomarina ramblicola]|nr:DUF6404 family protein [Idiomarina ramblicola]